MDNSSVGEVLNDVRHRLDLLCGSIHHMALDAHSTGKAEVLWGSLMSYGTGQMQRVSWTKQWERSVQWCIKGLSHLLHKCGNGRTDWPNFIGTRNSNHTELSHLSRCVVCVWGILGGRVQTTTYSINFIFSMEKLFSKIISLVYIEIFIIINWLLN